MTWEEVCDDPALQDLPYKIELNRWGDIEMRPVGNRRGALRSRIGYLLQLRKPAGTCHTGAAVETSENVKVTDVSWISQARYRPMQDTITFAIDPEICVEVLSPSNMLEDQMHKGQLYFQAGAEEFWLCDEHGHMRFFNVAGPLERSALCPGFPLLAVIPE